MSSADRDKASACIECGHDQTTWNPVNGFCEFDSDSENDEVDYCGCKCVFGFDSEGDRIVYECSLRQIQAPEWGNPPKMVTEFDEEKLISSIDTALAEARRETWEAAMNIVDSAGEAWGDQARAQRSKTYSAYVIAALNLKGRLEIAALEAAKEQDET